MNTDMNRHMNWPIDRPFEETLSNGIPVVLQHFDGAVASFYWWNQVGSIDEQKGEEGFAHFLEHMLFKDANAKDTGMASTGKTARAIESLGGDINAYTSFDQTVYHVTCAEHHWEQVIREFSVMARPQRFLKSDFEREREVIIEELKKNEDSPERQHFQALFSSTFKTHPYGRPVIGFEKTLRAATVSKLEAFYRRNYVASRMGLILVGPIADGSGARVKKLLALMEKYFGSQVFKRGRAPVARVKRKFDPLSSGKIHVARRLFEVQLPSVNFSFRVPELTHPDIAPLDLLSGALTLGESSRLYQSLFSEKALVTEVSGGVYVPKDPGMFYFNLDVDSPAKMEPALDEAFRLIRESTEREPTRQELERVLAHAESEKLYALQTADGIASRLGFLRFVMENLGHDERYLSELRSVTPERIREVAARTLEPARLSGAFLVPKKMEGEIDILMLERLARRHLNQANPEKSKARALKVPERAPYEEWVMPSGLKVIHRYRPQSHVVSVQVASLGGLRLELADPLFSRDEDWGVSQCMAMTWTKGTPTRTARQVAELVEGKAASLDGFSGRNTVGLHLTCLARDFVQLSTLFEDVLVNATFPEEEVQHSRRVMEDTLRTIEDHSGQLCSKYFLESLFLQHPYGALSTGSFKSVSTFGSQKLQRYLGQWVRPERSVVSIVGNISRAAVESWLATLEQHWRAVRQKVPAREIIGAIAPEPPLPGPRWAEKRLGREQVHIIRGGLGATLDSKDRHALRLLHTILGGQSGRLFIELREKQSLAYTVSPMGFEGVEPGYQGVYIACSPDKEKKALEGIDAVLRTLAKKGPARAEMERAREYFLGRRAMDMQSDSSLASYYGLELLYGLVPPTEAQVMERLAKVRPSDIQEVCRKYFVEPHQVTCAVG
jgi:zinc protease